MRKIPTIFVRDWEGTIGPPARFVLNEPHPDCAWVFAGEGRATQKLDGTSVMVRNGKRFKRRETKPHGVDPPGFELVEFDGETGKRIGWVPVGDGPEDRWHREAEGYAPLLPDGTYELIGPKIQGNPEKVDKPILYSHHLAPEFPAVPTDYEDLKTWLTDRDIEGIVWHHPDGRMGKIKKKDFGLART
jgi:hypothetical protein